MIIEEWTTEDVIARLDVLDTEIEHTEEELEMMREEQRELREALSAAEGGRTHANIPRK